MVLAAFVPLVAGRAIYRLIASGELPRPVKVGGSTRFYNSEIDAYLTELKAKRK